MSRRAVSADVARLGAYSSAIIAEGRFVYVSGQGPLRDGRYEPGGGVADETRLTLENVFAILAAAGCGPGDVVRCGVFLVDIGDFEEMNGAYAAAFPDPPPARTTVQVGGLPGGIRVEIDCVAVLP